MKRTVTTSNRNFGNPSFPICDHGLDTRDQVLHSESKSLRSSQKKGIIVTYKIFSSSHAYQFFD